MRTVVSWAWFRPSEEAWDNGARWYRCDIVGGGDQSEEYVDLPETAEGLLLGQARTSGWSAQTARPVAGSPKIPCSEQHDWRAVTTIKLGERRTTTPATGWSRCATRDFCSDSVGAWLNYPVDYDFGYTWFHEAEWEAGNRRSVCWAKTERLTRAAHAPRVRRRSRRLVVAARPRVQLRRRRRSRRPTAERRPPTAPAPAAEATAPPTSARTGPATGSPSTQAVAPTADLTARSTARSEHTVDHVRRSAGSTRRRTATCWPSTPTGAGRRSPTTCPASWPSSSAAPRRQRRLSMLRAVWFTPTVEESEPGAEWYRCDAIARRRPTTARAARAADAGRRARHARGAATAFGMCGTAAPATAGLRAGDLQRAAHLAGDRRRTRPATIRARAPTTRGQACEDAGERRPPTTARLPVGLRVADAGSRRGQDRTAVLGLRVGLDEWPDRGAVGSAGRARVGPSAGRPGPTDLHRASEAQLAQLRAGRAASPWRS